MGKNPFSAGFVVNQTVTVFAFLVLSSSLALATGSGTDFDPYVFNVGETSAAGLVSTSAPDYWKLAIPGEGKLLVQLSQGNVKLDVSFPGGGETINDNNARFYDVNGPGEARFYIYTASSAESNYLFTAYYTSPPPVASTSNPDVERNCWPIGFPSCLLGTPIICKEDAIGNTDWEQQTGSCSTSSTQGCPEGQPLCSAGTRYECQSNEWIQTGTCAASRGGDGPGSSTSTGSTGSCTLGRSICLTTIKYECIETFSGEKLWQSAGYCSLTGSTCQDGSYVCVAHEQYYCRNGGFYGIASCGMDSSVGFGYGFNNNVINKRTLVARITY